MRLPGFTLIELLVVIGVMAILFALTSINLTTSQRRTSLGETITLLAADLRSQQLKSMQGDASGGNSSDFGIFFEADDYVLFQGDSYDPVDSTNYIVELTPGFEFSAVDFPGSVIVFLRGSGEISGFVNDEYNLSVTDTQGGQTTTVAINRYGAVTQIN